MSNKVISNKKGFSLVECVVALLLFSIITGSVLTVFSASRNQIKKQNMQFKSDLLQSNIISAYEASSDYNNMANILGWEEKDADDTPEVPISGGNGNGSIPVPVHFDKITVDNDAEGKTYAKFIDDSKSPKELITFEGNYTNNKLKSSDIPTDYYTETPVTVPRTMVLEGQAHPTAEGLTGAYDYTYTITELKVKFEMGTGSLEKDTTDFDKYLLDNGLYLRCVKVGSDRYDGALISIKDGYNVKMFRDFYFEVFDINDNSKKQYICVSYQLGSTTITYKNFWNVLGIIADYANSIEDSLTYNNQLASFYNNTSIEKTYFSLTGATIKTYFGDSCPNVDATYSKQEATAEHKRGDPKFTELKADGYNFKTGNWYFVPWLAYRDGKEYQPKCKKYEPGRTYYEYTPKEGKASNIYYVLKNGKDIKIFDTDSVNIFSFYKDETKANTALNNNTCNISKATTRTYSDNEYEVWYQKGNMSGKTVSQIIFDDTKKEITVYSNDNQPFIRFIYKNNNSTYTSDKNSIKTGDYKEYYTVSGNTATIKSPNTVYFNCGGFTGPYSIKINDETVFISNAQCFEIKDAVPVDSSDISYGMIGEPISGSVNAKTYYVSCNVGNSDTSLVVKITFCDLAKPKTVDGETVEPEIKIWSIVTAKIPSDIKTIANCTHAHLERSYRKG
ncbi:MAG: type II secretion system GspH family protein [Clostridia bacterium]|nr:type II secretion system GspH family protein [Clostridia bacterium]